ncbi:MAG: flagellar biosynthesis regulator FlaF [Alphaproteobacteria bacterium]
MPQNSNAAAGYRQPARAGNSPQETEGRALLEAARRLSIAQKDDDDDAILTCVRLNWRLWTIFQAELTAPECTVPTEIRQNMLNLCNFVDKRTVEILATPKPELLTVLININRNVAAGLLSSQEEEQPATTPDVMPPSGTGGISA